MRTLLLCTLLACTAAKPLPAAPPAIEGVVSGADGQPIEGARVALINAEPDTPPGQGLVPLQEAVTGADGRFRFEPRPQRLAVTVTAAHRVPGFLTLDGRKGAQRADLALEAGEREVRVELRDAEGTSLLEPRAVAARISNEWGDVFPGLPQPDGSFVFWLDPKAKYEIDAWAAGRERRMLPAGEAPSLSLSLEAPVHDDEPAPQEVQAWLKAHALPLSSAEAGHGFDDLRKLDPLFEGAQVVGLGEATHGTREFFQLKHRLLEYLVSEKGFDLFAIEASFPETLPINDYVLGGKGDPVKLVEGMRFWTWATEEVVTQVKWLRAWNDQHPKQKVEFLGFDMQSPPASVKAALAFLRRADPAAAAALEPRLAPLLSEFLSGQLAVLPKERQEDALRAAGELEQQLDAHKEATPAWELARQHARVGRQGAAMLPAGLGGGELRDASMAENMLWLLSRKPGRRAVAWAHNGHIAREDFDFGGHLRKALGQAYRPIGFVFDHGAFQAMEMPFPSKTGLRTFQLPPSPPGSWAGALRTTGLPLLALDLRAAPPDGPVGHWLSAQHRAWAMGAGWSDNFARQPPAPQRFSAQFDGLLFVEHTSEARALPGVRVPGMGAPLPQPRNLDFTSGLEGWRVPGASLRAGYSSPSPGQLRLDPAAQRLPGFGLLEQRVDATPFRGKTLHLKGRLQAKGGGEARLFLTAWNGLQPLVGAIEPGAGPREAVITVPPNAAEVRLGFALEGPGEASVEGLRLEATP